MSIERDMFECPESCPSCQSNDFDEILISEPGDVNGDAYEVKCSCGYKWLEVWRNLKFISWSEYE